MEGSFETIASSLEALSQEYQTIAHNLANVNTVGYKRHCTAFTEELQAQTGDSSTADTGTIEPVLAIDYTQGALVQTGRKLDLALLGGGMLVVESEAGPLYTRNGALRVSTDGQLLNSAGQPVAGETGFITIPNTLSTSSVHIAPDGSVSAGGNELGKLRIVEFDDPSVLISVGASCFSAPEGAGPMEATGTTVRQGYQEAANVDIVRELVALITVTKLYEANLKSIQTTDEQMKTILQVAMS